MRVLLAGATGAVGAEVLHLLVVAGHYVRTLSRDAVRVKRLEGRAHEVRGGIVLGRQRKPVVT